MVACLAITASSTYAQTERAPATQNTFSISGPDAPDFPENSSSVIATYTVTGVAPGTTVSWDVEGTDARRFTIDAEGALRFKSARNYEKPNDGNKDNAYEVEVSAAAGSDYDYLEVTVAVTDANESPAFGLETARLSVEENASANTRVGSALTVTDPDDGDTWTFSVTGQATDSFSIDTEGQIRVRAGGDLDYENARVLSLTAVVTDAGGLSDSVPVVITLTDADDPGVVTFSPASPFVGTAFTAAIHDDDGVTGRIRWRWRRAQSVDDEFDQIDGATKSTYTPTANDEDYLLRVTVTYEDNFEERATASATSSAVSANAPPDFGSETASRSVAGGAPRDTSVGQPVTATDEDGDDLTYTLSGDDAQYFTIGATSGQITVGVENLPDAGTKSSYSLTVTATDEAGATDTITVTITATSPNGPPVITGPATVNYAENSTTTVATYSATDPEDDDMTWSIAGTDAARFSISSVGALSFKSVPNHESPNDANNDNVYEVTVRASDGSLTSTLDVEITVTNVNESGSITGPASVTYAENSTNSIATYTAIDPEDDSITWSIAGTDAARFSISSVGALSFKSAPDHESPNDTNADNVYEVTIRASDGNLTSTLEVEITVTNVNESGAITGPASVTYAENSTTTIATYSATDPEDDSVTWSISGTDATRFSISVAGALAFKSAPDYESPNDANADNVYEVTIRASDGSLTSTLAVEITVTNVNESGVITGPATVTYAENGTTTIATYSATDPEDDSVTWSIAGTDAARFSISSAGALSFKSAPDHESPNDANNDNVYEVTVRASDGNLTSTLAVEITVTNVNESGAITGPASVSYAENSTSSIATYSATDPDGDDVTWSIAGTDAARFSISAAGALSFKSAPNYESPNDANQDNVYEVAIRASDGTLTSTLDVEITVTNINESASITGPATLTYAENNTGPAATYSATDPEDDSVTWSITGTDVARFSISAAGALSFKSAPNYESPNDANQDNVYEVAIRASDGSLTSTLDVEITVTNVNESASITGPASVTYAENSTTTIATYSATDPEDDDMTWSIAGTDAARFSINAAGSLAFKSTPNYESPNDANQNNVYEVTIRASDGSLTSTLDVEITVTNVNESGLITGPATVTYAENGTTTVATYSATDPEDDDVTWSIAGTDAARFSISAAGALSFKSVPNHESPNDANQDNVYEVIVRASDGSLTSTLDVEITVTNINESGVITGPASVTYAENSTGPAATYSATDPEDDSVTWSIAGTDAARFSISVAGALSFKSAPNHESPNDANNDNVYEVTVRASDGTLTSTLDVEITVTNVNESGVITGPASVNYPENSTTTIATYTATDPEDDAVTWSIAGTDAARFSISTAGVLSFKSAPDYESPNDANNDNVYEVTVRASDGNLTSTLDVEITVTNVNESGTITGPASVTYAENATTTATTYSATDPEDDSVTWSIAGTDAARFSISSAGALSFNSAPNYESPNDANNDNVYEVTIRASDGSLTSTLDVEITVTNVNESGVITGLASINYPENNTTTIATYTATDPDGDDVTWSIAGTDAARFSISSAGTLSFKSPPNHESPNDANSDNVYEVTIRASDGTLTSTLDVEITVTNVNESAAITGPASVNYPENTTTTVATYSATDPEDDNVTWSIAGTDAARFSISSAGVLSFKSTPNYESPNDSNQDNVYEVTIRASDGSLTSTLDAKITVTNVNESGAITGPISINYPENATTTVATYSATDPEDDDMTWSIAGTDAARFSISSAGALSFKSTPNYESPNDANQDNVYEVTIRASDGTLTSTLAVEITVTNINESGAITGPAFVTYAENSTTTIATYSAIDPEDDDVTWSIAGTDAARFSISAAGALSFKSAPDHESPNDANNDNVYEVTIRASDASLTSTLDVEITVTNVNESAAITGPATVNYPENTTTTIATYSATDPEDDSVTWSIAGTDAARFSISAAGALSFKSTPNHESPNDANNDNVYEVTIRASDATLTSTLDTEITVTNVNESGAITGPASVTYPENSTTAVATYSATDPEDDSVTWSIAGTDAARFSISAAGALSFKSVPNHESPNDANQDNVYEVTVRASDGNLTSTLDVEITVTNVNESGTITGPASVTYAENATTTATTYSATDPEDDSVTWSIAGTDAARFSISSAGALSFKSTPNYESPNDANNDNVYEVTVRASDGTLTSTLDVEITVTNVNESGSITGPAAVNYPENTTTTVATYSATDPEDGDVTWSIAGTDAVRFSISSVGVLSFKSAPDYESPNDANQDNVYEVTIRASDGTLTSTLDVEITVTNVNESGSITGPASVNYAENGTTTAATYSATDPEDDSVTWSIAGTDAARFSISAAGALSFKSTPNYESPNDANQDNVYEITIRASDATLTSTLAVEITVTNVNESAVITGPATVNYPENTTTTVATYSATDPESDDMTWSIAGTDAARFSISSAGSLAFKSTPNYESPNDANQDNVYEVAIRASDGTLTSTLDVEITVTNVNESGTITGPAAVNYPENSTSSVATYFTTDPEDDAVTWSIAGTDAARFSISAAGVLSFKSAPNHESPNDANNDNVYEVTIRASDGTLTSTLDVEITVTNVNESASITGPATVNYAENSTTTVATYSATDPEDDNVTWSIAGTDAARFSISTAGALSFKSAPDHESPNDANQDNVYEVTIRASDGTLTSTLDVEIAVTNINESASITGPASVTYAENSTTTIATYSATDPEDDDVTWSIAGTDAALFTIDTDGVLAFLAPPNFENPVDADANNTYLVRIVVNDGHTESGMDAALTVTNANDAPRFPLGSLLTTIPENSCPGAHTVYYGIGGLDADGTDEDGDPLTYALSGPDAVAFVIHPPTGYITLGPGHPLDFEGDRVSFTLRVAVSDGRDEQGNVESEFVADDHLELTVTVSDVDEPPIFTEPTLRRDACGRLIGYEPEQLRRTVVSGAPGGSPVGAPVAAADPEGGQAAFRIVSQSDAGAFAIDATSGQITLAPDFSPGDARRVYTVRVAVSDDAKESVIEVRIAVENVPDLSPESELDTTEVSQIDLASVTAPASGESTGLPSEELITPEKSSTPDKESAPDKEPASDKEESTTEIGAPLPQPRQIIDPVFVSVEGAAQVSQFGKMEIQSESGRAQLVAPAGTLPSAYQVKIAEDPANCSDSALVDAAMTLLCVSLEFFDMSGEPVVPHTLNRPAALEIILETHGKAVEMMMRRDALEEWKPARFNVRTLADGSVIATADARMPGQYVAVLSGSDSARESAQSFTQPAPAVPIGAPASFVSKVAAARKPMRNHTPPPNASDLNQAGLTAAALVLDVTIVVSAVSISQRL